MEGQLVTEGNSKLNTPYIIRYPKESDVESIWRYANRLSQEKTYVRFQGEEIPLEKEKEVVAKWIRENNDKKGVTLVLEILGEVQGICGLEMNTLTESHVGDLALSINQSVRGQGLGEILMRTVMDEAQKNISHLEIFTLSYKEPNQVGKKLYEKLGFIEYGRLPRGTTQNGVCVDSVFMYKKA